MDRPEIEGGQAARPERQTGRAKPADEPSMQEVGSARSGLPSTHAGVDVPLARPPARPPAPPPACPRGRAKAELAQHMAPDRQVAAFRRQAQHDAAHIRKAPMTPRANAALGRSLGRPADTAPPSPRAGLAAARRGAGAQCRGAPRGDFQARAKATGRPRSRPPLQARRAPLQTAPARPRPSRRP